jgi:FAD dependent oxidoreductase
MRREPNDSGRLGPLERQAALVEAVDFAAGTSSRSSKLIHGGLRYLEQRNFALVREALQERGPADQARPPTWSAPSRSCTRCGTADGSGSRWGPGCCRTTPWAEPGPAPTPPPEEESR